MYSKFSQAKHIPEQSKQLW